MGQDPQEQNREEKGKHKEHAMPTIPDGVCGIRLSATLATLVAIVVGTTKRVTMYAPRMEAREVRKE